MKLRVTQKRGGRLLITLLLLIFMGIFTTWECTNIAPANQTLAEKQSDKLEIAQTAQSCQISKGVTGQLVALTSQCMREKKEKCSGDFITTKIIAVVINIMVMLIVIPLLVCQKKSKSVCEFMANIGKITDGKR